MSSRLRILVFLLLAPLPAVPSFAAPWMPLGPFGGTIFSLTVAPSDPHRLYAVTGEGLFRSTNGGASWTAIRGDSTSNVAVDPTRPDTIYAGTESGGEAGGVQKSTDGGAHWTALPLNTFAVLAVAVDPARPSRLYAGTVTQGVWRSTNGGASWQPTRMPLPGSRQASEVEVLAVPRAGGIVYAGTLAGVFKSVDAGATWKLASQGLAAGGVIALAVAPSDPKTVYAAVGNGDQHVVFQSRNGGDSWSPTSGPPLAEPPGRVLALAVSPRSPREVWAGTGSNGLFRSTDGGAHWSAAGLPPQERQIPAVAVAPSSPGTVYAGVVAQGADLGGVFASTDGGASWLRRNQGLFGLESRTVSPDEPGVLWAGLTGPGLFRSRNAGRRWERVALPGPSLPANGAIGLLDVEVAPSSSSIVYASGVLWLWRSGDGGATWTEVSVSPPGPDLRFLRIDPANPSHLWGSDSLHLFQSTDGGATWAIPPAAPSFGCQITDLAFARSSPSVLYVAGSQPAGPTCASTKPAFFRSVDGGVSWTEADAGLPLYSVTALAVDPHDPRRVYAGTGRDAHPPDTGRGVWKSTDGGDTWIRAGDQLADRTITALALAPGSGVLWTAAEGGAVFRSDDGGETWEDRSRGLQTSRVYRLAPDPADPGRIYAATAGGIWVLTETD
jgi:photosystem II stability/assembly factor-like uncharacterized protein